MATVAALRPGEGQTGEQRAAVARLVEDVRHRGDAALVDATVRFDWQGATAAGLRVAEEELEQALHETSAPLREAFATARDNLRWFHQRELRMGWEDEGPAGQRLGTCYMPVRRAGLYVPGGVGSYASTVIMNAVPAQVAGVEELFICTPPGTDGQVNRSVLAAARFMGIREVYRAGGAQAIAAMAFGTATIPRAELICGPGNAYVMEAKRQVFGVVGIDSLAGPSEVVVVADRTARPDWVAADLLAQEEHGSGAQAVLLAPSAEDCVAVARVADDLRRRVGADLGTGMGGKGTTGDAGHPSAAGGTIPGTDALWGFYPVDGEFLDVALSFVNEYAPEHLELHLADPRVFAQRVTAAGAVFRGACTPTVFGDYVAGSNHVLPTGGAARFSSPLSVDTFVRRVSLIELSPEAVRALVAPAASLAQSEGFVFHRLSAELRLTD